MIKHEEILQHLEEITSSKTFSRSNINVSLLRFLVQASLDNKELKEVTIGQEVFGKSYDPIKNDTKVRVYVHNLRKKLLQYYETENPTSSIKFNIQKGQYKVSYDRPTPPQRKSFLGRNIIATVAVSFILVVVISTMLIRTGKQDAIPNFWKEHFTNGLPNKLIVGDHFTVMGDLPTKGRGVFRDFNINSHQDFNEFIKNNPEEATTLSPCDFPYITKMGVHAPFQLSKWFIKYNTDLSVSLKSDWSRNNINKENIIFIGQPKTMGFLQQIFLETHPQYINIANPVTRKDPKTNKTTTYPSSASNNLIDYTVVSKQKGPGKNLFIYILSDNDIGVMQLVDFFTQPDSIKHFYQNHNLKDKDFTALFKVSGWERTSFNKELIALDIDKD
ncbi:hypothetical protein EYV94_04530 [Puteibacter caeruleilacunae]|nr:hypothetical protein EYV94_04530 [Puteibacter caeruleilacunae]